MTARARVIVSISRELMVRFDLGVDTRDGAFQHLQRLRRHAKLYSAVKEEYESDH